NRDAQRVSITIRQRLRFATIPARPNRADGVNDEARRQIVSSSKFGFAGPATTELAAFFQQLRAGRTVNRSVNSAAAEQCRVRGIHNRIDLKFGNIATDDIDLVLAR